MSIETEAQSVVKTAETVAANVAKAPAEVQTFWQKNGKYVTHTLAALAGGLLVHFL